MKKATSNIVVFLVIATFVGFSRLTGAQARSLVQERCSADSGCNETECSSSGTVICLDNKCTCLEFLGGSAPPPEIAQSPETGRCSTSRECEGKFKCVGDKVICSDGKCSCLDRQQAGNIRCHVLNDCRDLYCIDGRPKCVRHKCRGSVFSFPKSDFLDLVLLS